MAQINKPGLHFNTVLYTGNGGTNAITGVGFQPDWTWIKYRNDTYGHRLYDSVRGTTKEIYSNNNGAESTVATGLTAFGTDGFTLGSSSGVNHNSGTYVSWNWKAGAAFSNNAGTNGATIASTGKVNTTAGFSIVSFVGNQTSGATVAHGLGAVPKVVIIKGRDSALDWRSYFAPVGHTKYMTLNTTEAGTTASNFMNDTAPTSTLFSLGNGETPNKNGENYIAYCFSEKTGYSKFGSFEGNNNADGTFVYLGFKPSLIITKSVDTGGTNYDWLMFDNKRNTGNLNDDFLEANNSDAETTSGRNAIDFLSNGFKCRTSYGDLNSNQTYIYMAFAENPIVGTNNIPATAR